MLGGAWTIHWGVTLVFRDRPVSDGVPHDLLSKALMQERCRRSEPSALKNKLTVCSYVTEVVWTSGDMNATAISFTWKTWTEASSAIVSYSFESTEPITLKTWYNGKKGPWSHWPLHLQQQDYLFLLKPQSFQHMLLRFVLSHGICLCQLKSAHELHKCF